MRILSVSCEANKMPHAPTARASIIKPIPWGFGHASRTGYRESCGRPGVGRGPVAGLYYGRQILIPLAIAFLITFTLNPPITWLARLGGLPRLLVTSLVMVAVVCALVGLGAIFGTGPFDRGRIAGLSIDDTDELADLRQNLKAPGLFDGVLKTFERVQKEVELKDKALPPTASGNRPHPANAVRAGICLACAVRGASGHRRHHLDLRLSGAA
ncbi:MAG TPA: hypothetical protein VFS91_00665 [Nitrobacter sp.]|jgi:hypothetical protein|nr:hypothetical protein [Nitrobacter sp.]